MRRFQAAQAPQVEPEGHFGGLAVADVVPFDVGGSFSVQLSYCPPGGGGEMHSHANDTQLFLIVEGELTFGTGDDEFTLGPHDAVLFEPGEKHSTRNESDANSVSVVATVHSSADPR